MTALEEILVNTSEPSVGGVVGRRVMLLNIGQYQKAP